MSEDKKTYTFMTVNVGTQKSEHIGKADRAKSKDEPGGVEGKKRSIYLKKIKESDPDIIAIQEPRKIDIKRIQEHMKATGSSKKKEESKEYYVCKFKEDQAAILVKASKFQSSSFEVVDFDDSDTDLVSEVRARLALIKVKPKSSTRYIYLGSWHGKHKISIPNKKTELKNLEKLLIKKCGRMAVAIGGDFNLARSSLPAFTKFTAISDKPGNIDYFIYAGSSFKLVDVGESKYKDKNANAFLDHTPYISDVVVIKSKRRSITT